jgi:NAD(P)-dependent dehydrogenase (short-subunit alcohol dehydrogenase family)
LANKVAIITGGRSHRDEEGTGCATSICLAKEEASVLAADSSVENAERKEIRPQYL